jgi:hypothetical protein
MVVSDHRDPLAGLVVVATEEASPPAEEPTFLLIAPIRKPAGLAPHVPTGTTILLRDRRCLVQNVQGWVARQQPLAPTPPAR